MMPSSSKSKSQSARRPVLRFELEQVRLGERPNAYKKPQLVLKPQLELPAREIYTGVQPRRIPIWHHYLMVHVKDKADELVKIDLNDFSQPSNMSGAPVSQHSVFAFLSELSVVFEYPDGMRNVESFRFFLSSISIAYMTNRLLRHLRSPLKIHLISRRFSVN